MKKNNLNYSDFSKRELETLKEYYIIEKVKSMNESELRQFANEVISHQIKHTIGDEEEKEAWEEIENFFKGNFESILDEIKKRSEATNQDSKIESKTAISNVREQVNNENKKEKIDMWID